MLHPFLLPLLMIQAPVAPLDAVELAPGVFVLRGAPNAATYAALKQARITRVIDVRRDGEPGADHNRESAELTKLGITYSRYALGVAPPRGDFDRMREILRDLPSGSRVLVHCGDGNRAAAAVCGWLIMERGLAPATALRLAHQAGLRHPDTEAAFARFLAAHGKS